MNLQEKGITEWEKEACATAQCYASESGNPMTSLSLNTAQDASQELGNPTMTEYDNNYTMETILQSGGVLRSGSMTDKFHKPTYSTKTQG